MIATLEDMRRCRDCNKRRPLAMFDFRVTEGKEGRRRYCLICRPDGLTWPEVVAFPLPADPSFGIATSTVFDRLDVILACWDLCRREGPAAMARLLHQIWEVSYQADAVLAGQLRNVVSQARAGAVSLEFARRQVEGMA